MKRIISMLLALVLVVGCMAPMAVPASAAEKPEHLTDCGELKLGERVDMDDVCDVYFSFTPAETGVYTFKNYASSALGCGLYDSQWNWMGAKYNDYYDAGFFVTRTLFAGETYYFWVTAKEGYLDDIRATLSREEISAASGEEYGTNWAYSEDGVLTISGSGGVYASEGSYGEDHWSDYKYIATKLVIEEGITKIGSNAFSNYELLTSVTIPSTVTSIGEGAFSGCSGLTEVTVPDGVTEVEESTFSGCTGLKTVNLPDTVTGIGESAFAGCSALTQIDIPDTVTWFGDRAFQNCAALAQIDIPDTVETIGGSAFKGCSSLKTVVIPEEVSGINSEVFADCTALTSVTLPGELWKIGDSAFSGCAALTAVTLPEKLYAIGLEAFAGCTSLTEVAIPASVEAMERDSFDDGIKITIAPDNEVYSIDASGVMYEYDDYNEMTKVMKVPADIQGTYEISTTVGGIGSGAFQNCTGMTAVVIPENVTRIEESAFWNCTGLTEVGIPASVTTLGSSVFKGCTNLASVSIPDGVTSIGASAFSDCTSLTSLSIPDSVTMIGSGLITNCVNLTSLTLGNGITTIMGNTFENVSLTEITLPDSVKYIWQEAFVNCPNLTTVNLGSSLETVSTNNWTGVCDVFVDCPKLASLNVSADNANYASEDGILYNKDMSEIVAFPKGKTGEYVVPESVTWLKKYTFEDCAGLTGIVIHDGAEMAKGESYFGGCTGLETLTLGAKAYVWGGDLEDCVNLKTISVSKDNPDLCTDEFGVVFNKDMTELKAAPKQMAADYQIPEGVTIIDGSAFSHSNLTSVTIPASVVEIKYEAFEACANLSQITFLGSAPEISYSAFSGVTATVEYPTDDASWEEVVESDSWTEDTHLTWGKGCEHTVVIDEAVAATCTESGLTEGSHCSECGAVLVAQETVEALGHSAGEWTFDETAHWRECAVCGEKLEWDEHTYEPGNDADCIVCDYTKSVGLLGDVDGSGSIDFFDGMYILQYYAGIISESELDVSVADVDGSGSIDFFDGMYVLQFYAGIITEFTTAG